MNFNSRQYWTDSHCHSRQFWADSHCHLQYEPLFKDLDSVLMRAKENNVGCMICVSTDMHDHIKINSIVSTERKADDSSSTDRKATESLAQFIYQSIGIHPLSASKYSIEEIKHYLRFVDAKKVVAVGETGLDDYRETMDAMQIPSFEAHIEYALEMDLPIIMHNRAGANNSRVEDEARSIILGATMPTTGRVRGVAHCFGGSQEFADFLLAQGWYISFAGNLTYKNNKHLQDIAKNVPIDRILIETDAPFLAPEGNRGKTNEPANVIRVGQKIAELKGLSTEEVMKHTCQNLYSLFTKC